MFRLKDSDEYRKVPGPKCIGIQAGFIKITSSNVMGQAYQSHQILTVWVLSYHMLKNSDGWEGSD